MTNDDVKKIAKVVKSEISEALVPIHEKLDEHSAKLDAHSAKLDAHSAKLDNHTASLMSIEATLEGYADMYKVNKDNIEELNQRVDEVEEQIGLTPRE